MRILKRVLAISTILFSMWLLAATDTTVTQYYGKTADEVSGLTSAGTKPTKAWFDQAIFDPLVAAIGKHQWEDTLTSVRMVVKHDGLIDAIFNDESTPQSGDIHCPPFRADSLLDTTVWLADHSRIVMPPGYRLFFRDNDLKNTKTNTAFASWGDTSFAVYGGEIYGNSESVWTSCTVVSSTDSTVVVTGLDVVADSLNNWFIYYPTDGYSYKIEDTQATAASNTTIEITTTWDTNPVATNTIQVTAAQEHNHAFLLKQSRNFQIKDVNIHKMSGDGIDIFDCSDWRITNCKIFNPLRSYRLSGTSHLIGRQGISVVTNQPGSSYSIGIPAHGSSLTIVGDIHDWQITDNEIYGGTPGAIDLEPNDTTATIRDGIIANNIINGGSRGIAIEGNSYFKNILMHGNVIRNVTWGGSLVSPRTENIIYYDNDFQFTTRGLYMNAAREVFIIGNTFESDDSTATHYIETLGEVQDIFIIGNTFINPPVRAITIPAGERIHIIGNTIINPGHRSVSDTKRDAMLIQNCEQVVIADNVIYERSGNGTMYSPGLVSYCDSVIIKDNIVWGGVTNDFRLWGCDRVTNTGNVAGFQGSSTDAYYGASGDGGGELMSIATVANDTMLVDSSRVYLISFFGTSGVDTVFFTGASGADSLLSSEAADTSLRIYNDSLWVASSDYVSDDSMSIRLALFNDKSQYGSSVLGDTCLSVGDVSSETWITFPGYRDVVTNDPIGSVLKGVSVSRYAVAAAQYGIMEAWTNPDDRNITREVDIVRSWTAKGGKLYPENLVLDDDTITQFDDSTGTVTPVAGLVLTRNDTIYIYDGSNWQHFVADGSGVDPTNNQ